MLDFLEDLGGLFDDLRLIAAVLVSPFSALTLKVSTSLIGLSIEAATAPSARAEVKNEKDDGVKRGRLII